MNVIVVTPADRVPAWDLAPLKHSHGNRSYGCFYVCSQMYMSLFLSLSHPPSLHIIFSFFRSQYHSLSLSLCMPMYQWVHFVFGRIQCVSFLHMSAARRHPFARFGSFRFCVGWVCTHVCRCIQFCLLSKIFSTITLMNAGVYSSIVGKRL